MTVPTDEDQIKNVIDIQVTSLTDNYNTELETVKIKAQSETSKLTSYYLSDHEVDEQSIVWTPILPYVDEYDLERTYNTLGTYYIYFKDEKGNVEYQEIPITKIDREEPIITGVSGNPSNWVNQDVTLTIEGASDTQSGLANEAYSFDNGVTWQSSNSKTYTSNTDHIVIQVRDQLGHIYTHPEINITMIDKTNPTITNVSGNPSSWQTEATLIVDGVSDTQSGLADEAYSFDNGVTWQSSNVKKYTSNTNNIIIKVRDKAGNVYTHSVINITKIDDVVPTAKISVSTSLGTITISENGSSDTQSGIKNYQYSKDNKNW